MLRRHCIRHVVGGHTLQVEHGRQLHQLVITYCINRVAVIPQFHQHIACTKRINQYAQHTFCFCRAMLNQRAHHRTLRTTREYQAFITHRGTHCCKRKHRCTFAARKLPFADRTCHMRITLRATTQQHNAALGGVRRDIDAIKLDTKDGGQSHSACGFCKTHNAVQPVAIGNS